MSYIQFQQQCKDCKEHWNAAFGIFGTTQIAAPPDKCPHCGSYKLEKFVDGWTWNSPVLQPDSNQENKVFDPEKVE